MTFPTRCLTVRLAAWPATPDAHRPAPGWAADPILAAYANPAGAATAARSDPGVLAALAARRGDEPARLAALAAVATHLVPVVGRWARSGVPGPDLEDMDAELICEALDLLATRTGLPAARVAGLAWGRVSDRRRTQRSRAARLSPLDDDHVPLVAAHPGRVCLTAATTLVAVAALSGWSTREATTRLGITPAAWRTRTWRARTELLCGWGVD